MGQQAVSGIDTAEWWRNELTVIVRERIGMHEEFAVRVADALFCGFQDRNGGREIYVPAPEKSSRDAQIRGMFNGRNLVEVMRHFGVSKATVYRACNK